MTRSLRPTDSWQLREGVFCEPASAASVARDPQVPRRSADGTVVCTLTGHGLKDPETAVLEPSCRAPIDPNSRRRSMP